MSILGFLGGSDGKESACNAGDLGLIPGSGRSPGGGHGNPLQCSCLENHVETVPQGRKKLDLTEARWRTVHPVSKVEFNFSPLSSSVIYGVVFSTPVPPYLNTVFWFHTFDLFHSGFGLRKVSSGNVWPQASCLTPQPVTFVAFYRSGLVSWPA